MTKKFAGRKVLSYLCLLITSPWIHDSRQNYSEICLYGSTFNFKEPEKKEGNTEKSARKKIAKLFPESERKNIKNLCISRLVYCKISWQARHHLRDRVPPPGPIKFDDNLMFLQFNLNNSLPGVMAPMMV